jgi:Domain of unknown function (DUF4911)
LAKPQRFAGSQTFAEPGTFTKNPMKESADGLTFQTVLLAIAPAGIARFKAIIESYDNLATMRTEDPRHHYVRLYFDAASVAEVEALLDSLSAAFSIRRIDS